MKRKKIKMIEYVEINGRKLKARIDTGARRSSIDKSLAKRLKLGPIIKRVEVKSVHGKSNRPVVRSVVKIGGRKFKSQFNLADRKDMKFDVLIGRNLLRHGFLIDTSK